MSSSDVYASATKNDVYFRACDTNFNRGEFILVSGGWSEKGGTYSYTYSVDNFVIPRLVIYDCNEYGSNEYGKGSHTDLAINYHHEAKNSNKSQRQKPSIQMASASKYMAVNQEDEDLEEKEPVLSKMFTLEDVKAQPHVRATWAKGSRNPDNLLAEIHAANPGFESLMHKNKGSFMLRYFVEKVLQDIRSNKSRFIYQIFDEIQDLLKKRQQIKFLYYSDTRYIKLNRNLCH